jgi:hypothetical protein
MSLESETERISKNMARALAEIDRLRASRDRLLTAAKNVVSVELHHNATKFMGELADRIDDLEAAIAAAEEQTP